MMMRIDYWTNENTTERRFHRGSTWKRKCQCRVFIILFIFRYKKVSMIENIKRKLVVHRRTRRMTMINEFSYIFSTVLFDRDDELDRRYQMLVQNSRESKNQCTNTPTKNIILLQLTSIDLSRQIHDNNDERFLSKRMQMVWHVVHVWHKQNNVDLDLDMHNEWI